MHFGQIERELLAEEVYSIGQKPKFPEGLQLLVDQEKVTCDIWECQNTQTSYNTGNTKFQKLLK